MMLSHVIGFCWFLCFGEVDLLNNGLALRPPMGWMSWGHYECAVDCEKNPNFCLNEQLIINVADAFYNDGYQEAGYEYIIIDDCWSEKHRDKDGRLVPDKKRFPNGMRYLADYIHSKGLKFGMYTNVAEVTCKLYPGSRDYFKIDAQSFAEWGVDYLKLKVGTGCLSPGQGRAQMAAYAMMSAPLIISCDMASIGAEDRSTLQNLDLIAIAQDDKGLPAKPTRLTPYTTLWVKTHAPYKGNRFPTHTFAFINLGSAHEAMDVVPKAYGLNCTDGYTVLNVFTGVYVKNITLDEVLVAHVPGEDALVYTLYPL